MKKLGHRGGWVYTGTLGATLACAAAIALAAAPAGSLDRSFGSRGVAQLGRGYELSAVAVQSDGRVVVAGLARRNGAVRLAVARLTPKGRLDRSFNGGSPQVGAALVSGGSIGSAVAIQPDGGILVAGFATDRSGIAHNGMLVERFTSSGGLDRRFASGGAAIIFPLTGHGAANALALQRDGKIILAGSAAGSDYLDRIALARLTPSGQLDQGFGSQGVRVADGSQDLGRMGSALGVALQPSGRIVIAGSRRPELQSVQAIIAGFDSRGNLDRGFGQGGSFIVDPAVANGGSVAFNAIALDPGGAIVAAGAAASGGPTPAFALVARLSSGGTPNLSFGRGGVLLVPAERGSIAPDPIPGANGVVIVRGGNAVLAGFFQDAGSTELTLWTVTPRGGYARLGAGGGVRAIVGKYALTRASALAVAPDGGLVVAGTSDDFRARRGLVVRYAGLRR